MKSTLDRTQELKRRVLSWAVKLRVNPNEIRVQEMRRKWGSCSSAGTITLAADLAEQDTVFQDYVIVHELLHLRLASHGRVFSALLSAHVPGWQAMEAQRVARRKEISLKLVKASVEAIQQGGEGQVPRP